MTDKYDVVLRLEVDRRNGGKVLRVGVKRPAGSLRWVADWLCGQQVERPNMNDQWGVADTIWWSLVSQTVGIQDPLF